MQKQLAAFIPQIQKAINEIDTRQQLTEWANSFLKQMASICLPDFDIEIKKKVKEEIKEQPKFKQVLETFVTEFTQIVTQVEQDISKEILKLQIEKNELLFQDSQTQISLLSNPAQNFHKIAAIETREQQVIERKNKIEKLKEEVETKVDKIFQGALLEIAKKSRTLRRSELYRPLDLVKPQNIVWPLQPSYDNPLVAILGKHWSSQFNFVLLDGQRTNFPTEYCVLQESRLNPDRIRKAVLWWEEKKGRLFGIQLVDKNNEVVMSSGIFYEDQFDQHVVQLAEGERIVGVALRNSGNNANHQDFQLIIAKRS